jgi:superfamily II DNA helicase RecQ
MIKDGEKASDEEKKNQIDAVNEVASYCQNEVDCRRAYILRYFGQTFDPAECRKGCNNCLDMRAVQKVELTQAAISLVKLVQSLNQRATRAQCLDIFKGAKARPIREKGFDQNPHFGDGGSVPRAHADRVFDNLLMTEVLKEVCITNTQGWNNMYIEVCGGDRSLA